MKRAKLVILVVSILAVPLLVAQVSSSEQNSDRYKHGLLGSAKSYTEHSMYSRMTDADGKTYPEVHSEYQPRQSLDAHARSLSVDNHANANEDAESNLVGSESNTDFSATARTNDAAMSAHGSPELTKNKQDTCGGVHKPGDILTCYVTFEARSDLTSLEVVFNLPREDKPRQFGSAVNFILSDTTKIGPHSYSVSGAIPDCVPGAYILAAVLAHTASEWQQYMNLGQLTIVIENDSGDPRLIEMLTEEQAASGQNAEIVQTPPPEPSVFPRITRIRSAPANAPPPMDIVHIVGRLFRRQDRCGGSHNQGDILDCRVAFQGNPQFTIVALHFIREGHASQYESQLCRGVGLGAQQAVRPTGTYRVTGAVLKCAAGRYRISEVDAFGYSGNDPTKPYAKDYMNGSDFKCGIVLNLRDTARLTFPAIVAVTNSCPIAQHQERLAR